MFEPFERVDHDAGGRQEGAGLGLSTSRQLVQAMGGDLQATSTPGEGSEFSLTLPRAPGPAADRAEPSAPARAIADRALSVLVVDDHPVNCQVARVQLERLGYDSVEVNGGQRALTALAEGRFDVVLLDVQMPKLDGFETCRRIRADAGRYGRPKILMMSARLSKPDRRRCRELGADGDLAKPVTLHGLAAALNRSLGDASSAASAEDVDHSRLENMRAMFSEQRWREVLESFVDTGGTMLTQMRHALAASDAKTLRRLAHKMRGTSVSMGAARIAEICTDIEASCQAGELDGLPLELERLEEAWGSFGTSVHALPPA